MHCGMFVYMHYPLKMYLKKFEYRVGSTESRLFCHMHAKANDTG